MISFLAHADLYDKKRVGYLFLYSRARPLPMTPTQLTGFTIVSICELKILPFTYLIMALGSFMIKITSFFIKLVLAFGDSFFIIALIFKVVDDVENIKSAQGKKNQESAPEHKPEDEFKK